MSGQFAIEDVGSMGRRNSPPFDDPNNQLALPGQSSRGGKYGASPDVRNAVMDYYKSDKKDTTANLSALLSTVRGAHPQPPARSPQPAARSPHHACPLPSTRARARAEVLG
jgi:hypothetical protein